ncbi:MAG: DNA recombination protein RmuC [Pelodictyon phaeoclathratiforme]|nr:DNA recombination protein RmuC [Pelodictyon phaeoclathratiforme]MBV5289549.1 DNA recombination protein RmuC [Pelodictyon phaeoclathratiforme]
MTTAISVLLFLPLFLLLAFVAYRIVRDAPLKIELQRLQGIEDEARSSTLRLESKSLELENLRIQFTRLEADMANEQRSSSEKIALMQESETRLKIEFENLSNRIFEERGRALGLENRERMDALLQPLREQLDSFRKRVEEVHSRDTEQSTRLIEQVRQLQELSGRVSDEANMLARAIKGDSKKQGDWGEMIIERIFEASGLEKGREYLVQESFRAEDGILRRPDFMVLLPGNKAVIVDSKVSLTAYERFCSLDQEPQRQTALKEHVHSVRRHIGDLQAKEYSSIAGNRTLDFVIMCIPLEPAWQTVMQNDPELIYDLAGKDVVLCGPTTLMITLKLIVQIWRRENENRNAELIAEKAGRIYDQVFLVVEAMTEARKKLSGVSDSFDLALKRLKEGRGNLVGRVEEIRRLGAKVTRQIPPDLVADAEDGAVESE